MPCKAILECGDRTRKRSLRAMRSQPIRLRACYTRRRLDSGCVFLFFARSHLEGHDLLLLLAEAFDAEGHDVASLEEDRRLHAEADARRRAGGDDVARLQHHELRHVMQDVSTGEDHRVRAAGLHALAVDVEVHRQALYVLDLVAGNEPGAEWAEGLGALALHPLAATLDLEVTLGDVVADGVAGDVLE